MEQQNPLNEIVKQLKGALGGFLTPQVTFIANAAFAVVALLLFLLQPNFIANRALISIVSNIGAGVFGLIVVIALAVAAIALPLKNKKLSAGLNFFLIGFMALFSVCVIFKWSIVTILLLILILLPWAVFTLIKKDDEVSL